MQRKARAWCAVAVLAATIPGPVAASSFDDDEEPGTLWAKVPSVLADVQRRFGTAARIMSLEIHAEETVIAVQDPAVPAHVDRHTYAANGGVESEPLAVGRNERRIRAQLFRVSEVDLAVLPRILAAAPAAVDTEGGTVRHAILARTEGMGESESWGAPRWRVYVEGPRGGGYVEYGLDGARKRVTRW